jgi:hypothetical protein
VIKKVLEGLVQYRNMIQKYSVASDILLASDFQKCPIKYYGMISKSGLHHWQADAVTVSFCYGQASGVGVEPTKP